MPLFNFQFDKLIKKSHFSQHFIVFYKPNDVITYQESSEDDENSTDGEYENKKILQY